MVPALMTLLIAGLAWLIFQWKKGNKKLAITIFVIIGIWFIGAIVYDEMRKNTRPMATPRNNIDDPFKARQNPLDDIFPTPSPMPESQQAPSVTTKSSREPGRDAYVQKLDALISDGTPAIRLQTMGDPAFVTFLSMKDRSTGRLIRDIAEEADRKHDAVLMSEVYKGFFTWKKNASSQR